MDIAARPTTKIFARLAGFKRGLRSFTSGAIQAFTQPERWAHISCCDWYPDGFSFPSNHAALLRENSKDSTARGQ